MSNFRVWFVSVGNRGYLPDSITAYPTLECAIDGAMEEKNIVLDGMGEEWRVTGNIRKDREYEVWCDDSHRWNVTIFDRPAWDLPEVGELLSWQDVYDFCEDYNNENW